MAFNLGIISGSILPHTTPFQVPPNTLIMHIHTSQKEITRFFSTGKIFWTLMFGWVFKFSKALQGFLPWDRLPLLNIKEGPVLYEMKYLVIPKAMNPSRNSHCKTDQIMRNTFLFPDQHKEKREKEMWSLFWAVGLLEMHRPSKHWTERVSKGKLPSCSEPTGRADGWRLFASSKRFTDKSLRDSIQTATVEGGTARQNSKP